MRANLCSIYGVRNGLLIALSAGLYLLPACSGSRVQGVDPGLYKSLPNEIRGHGLSEMETKWRVIDGKIAKARADIGQINQEMLSARRDAEQRHAEVSYTRALLQELKHEQAKESVLQQTTDRIAFAKHQWKLAKLNVEYKTESRRTLEQQIIVLEAERNVAFSEIELAKIQQVHEFTNYRVPDADLQVAGFKRQLRQFEVEQSRAKYQLSRREIAQAKDKQKLRQWEAMTPVVRNTDGSLEENPQDSISTDEKASRQEKSRNSGGSKESNEQPKKSKPFWQNLFSRQEGQNQS